LHGPINVKLTARVPNINYKFGTNTQLQHQNITQLQHQNNYTTTTPEHYTTTTPEQNTQLQHQNKYTTTTPEHYKHTKRKTLKDKNKNYIIRAVRKG
jgi:chitodextrinase